MSLIETLRKPRFLKIALFDLLSSIIGLVVIFVIAQRVFFKDLNVIIFIIAGILTAVPLGIVFHVIFGINTSLNYMIGLSEKPVI